MNKIWGWMVAVALLATGGVAQAQEVRRGAHTHDGFFLQMDIGPGYMKSSVSESGSDMDLSGGAGQFSIGIGGALTRNFIMAGQLWGVTAVEPDVKLNDQSFGEADATLTLSGLGLQLVYYFMPLNLYVSATPSITTLSLDTRNGDADTETGFGLKLAVGKEWWVSDNWALGLNGQFAWSTNKDNGASGSPNWNTTWLGVAFSATYN